MENQNIQVVFNGDAMSCASGETLSGFLQQLGYEQGGFATAINSTFVPRSDYDNTQLHQGDMIEVVAPMQGG